MLLFPSLLLSLLMRDLLKMCARLKSEDMDIFVRIFLVYMVLFARRATKEVISLNDK